jgi:hypothetical protein
VVLAGLHKVRLLANRWYHQTIHVATQHHHSLTTTTTTTTTRAKSECVMLCVCCCVCVMKWHKMNDLFDFVGLFCDWLEIAA